MVTVRQIAKAILLTDSGSLLMLRRSPTDKTRPGELDLAGGWLEQDETPSTGVIREVKEETGIMIDDSSLELVYSTTNFHNDANVICFLFLGRIKDSKDVVLSYEHDEYYLMSKDEVTRAYDHPVWGTGLRYLVKHGVV